MNDSDSKFPSTREMLIGAAVASPLLLVLALILEMVAG
jgi:hypothetical protein